MIYKNYRKLIFYRIQPSDLAGKRHINISTLEYKSLYCIKF